MRSLQDYGFPPFTRAVKMLVLVNTAVFLVLFILHSSDRGLERQLVQMFGLVPTAITTKLWIWQILTYSFMHEEVMHILFNMLGLWMFGARLEQDWGRSKFLEFFFVSAIGAALCTIAISHTHVLGMDPNVPTIGASGGIYGLLVAFGILYANMRIYVLGIFPITAKWFAVIWVGIALLSAIGGQGDVNNVAHLGGAAFGYLYLKLVPPRGMRFLFSEGFYGLRNRYHRVQRKRMARKFEVYMRQHDREQYFDEHGNYRDPSGGKKGNGEGGSGKWVN